MAKKVDPVVSMMGSFQNTAVLLEKAVRERHGSFAEALVLLGRPEHEKEVREIASILACITLPKESSIPDGADVKLGWMSFYERYFPAEITQAGGLNIIHTLSIPEQKDDFERLLIVIPGISMNRVYDECAKHFKCWRYVEDLDKDIPTNDPRAGGSAYVVRLRDRIEADEEHKNKSAKDLAISGIKGITLLERMLLELKYFDETGKHLDIQNVTLCSGSRDADGYVPYAHWSVGRFDVYWLGPSYRSPLLRVREVLC